MSANKPKSLASVALTSGSSGVGIRSGDFVEEFN